MRIVAWVALAVVFVGVFSTWTKAGPVTLNGTQGPNNGWLVVIVAALAFVWVAMMGRSSWWGAIGVLGVLGSAGVICWTAIENWIDNGDVLDASVGYGLLLVLVAGAVLAVTAAARGVQLLRGEGSA